MPDLGSAFRSAWAGPILIASCIFLLPVGRTVELPMAIMAIAGLTQLLRHPRETLQDSGVRLLALLFACFWLPMLFALPDAVSFDRAASTTAIFLRFLFMGIFILHLLREPAALKRLVLALTLVMGFWTLDALIQLTFGQNLFGHPYDGGRLRGIYYPEHKMGNVMAILLPVFAAGLLQLSQRWRWSWLAIFPYVAVILLSGSRTAWLMMLFGLAAYGILLLFRTSWDKVIKHLPIVLVMATVTIAALGTSEPFQRTMENTAGLTSGDYEQTNRATSLRLPIWQVGLKIFQDHWINGIGPRGFRNCYPGYAEPRDMWIRLNPKQGPTHPHQITLEIGVETGVIGLIGFGLFWLWWLRRWWSLRKDGEDLQLPWLAALGVSLFPLNAGHAIYDSFSSGIAFLLLVLTVASIANSRMVPTVIATGQH